MGSRVDRLVSAEDLLRRGVPGSHILSLLDFILKRLDAAYGEGFADGVAANVKTLTGHEEISKFLGVSERQSQRIVKEMRERHLLLSGPKGKLVVVKKSVLRDFYEEVYLKLAAQGGSC
jgi:hypothetical protein